MKTINCNNSTSKSVSFFANGNNFIAFAEQDREYWFTIGHFKTLAGAKRSAVKQMARMGYTFNEKEMQAVTL